MDGDGSGHASSPQRRGHVAARMTFSGWRMELYEGDRLIAGEWCPRRPTRDDKLGLLRRYLGLDAVLTS